MSDERDLQQRVRSAIARVPVTEQPLGARRPRRRGSGFLAVGAALVILITAIGAGQWLATYRAGSAASCGSLEVAGSSPQAQTPIRTIRLDQRWTIDGVGTLCVAGINVYDGVFDIVAYEQSTASLAEPWTSAGSGLSLGFLSDDRGRIFAGSSSRGFVNGPSANARVSEYQGLIFPSQDTHGDLLAGVHELHYKVQRVLDAVNGPWRFDGIAAKAGGITATSIMSGREMRISDLVLRPDGFSVAYLPLGQVTTGSVVMSDPLTATDDRGTAFTFAGVERVGSSPNLYAKFTPAPPPGAVLSIVIPRVYVATERTWEGTLTLPATGAASSTPATSSATAVPSAGTAVPSASANAAMTIVGCGTLVVNSVTAGQGSGPNTYELLSPTGVAVGRFGWDAGRSALGTYVCVRTIPGAPMTAFSSLIRAGEPGYIPEPAVVATDSCGSVTAYASDGAHMLVTLTAGGTATQYDLQFQFVGGTSPTDIGTRFSAGTPQWLLITGAQVAPDSGSPNAISLRQYNVARVSGCTPTSSVKVRPAGFTLPHGCAYIDQPIVGADQTAWSFDCGVASRDARGTLAYALTQQGWTSCGAVTATASWAKGTARLWIAEGAGGPGGYPKLTQPARPAASSSCP